jgi:hypothetical protein
VSEALVLDMLQMIALDSSKDYSNKMISSNGGFAAFQSRKAQCMNILRRDAEKSL